MSKMVLFNADDFGWTDGQNLAVEKAHVEGVLNRASILANGSALNQAIEIASRLPSLSIGVHLTLNEGYPILPSEYLGHLVTAIGCFWQTPTDLMRLWLQGHLTSITVLPEWRAQLERVVQAGIKISHLDSHKHVHMLPPLLSATIHLARSYGIPYIRLPLENIKVDSVHKRPMSVVLWAFACRARRYLVAARIRFADRFIGFGHSGKMSIEHLERAIQQHSDGVMEVMVHPAVITPAVEALRSRYRWAANYRFEQELDALIELKSHIMS